MFELHVKGMSCGGCAGRVTRAISALDAAAKVTVDVPQRIVAVETIATHDDICEALAEAGYPARPRENAPQYG